MRKIEFFDTSLRDGEQTPGVSFSISEKVTIAKQLEKWGITVIEAGFPAASPDSFEAVKQIADSLNDTAVTALARCVISDIDKAVEAVKGAKYPQIHVFIATSPIHMKYKLKISPEEVLKNIDKCVRYARERVEVVEFSPEDATRTELNFLLEAVQTAVDAGATYINIPDTVGYTTPEEYGKIFKFLIENIKSEREIIFSPHCHDDLGMAVANSLAAIKAGAGRVEGTVNGIGERAGNAALEEIAVALHIRKDFYQAQSPLKLSETAATAELISQFSGIAIPKNKAIVGANAFAHESGIHQDGVLKNAETYEIITPELVGIKHNSLPLGKLSGRHAFSEKLTELNIAYDDESLAILFEKFKISCIIYNKLIRLYGDDYMWAIFAILSAIFAALTSILAKIGIEGVNSNLATAIRTIVVVFMAWFMVFITGSQSGIIDINKKSWIFLILSGLATGASWLCYYKALQLGEASKVVPIDKLSIVITIILAFVFLGEQITIKTLIGCTLIVAGTFVMIL